jgi:hypothetical protein
MNLQETGLTRGTTACGSAADQIRSHGRLRGAADTLYWQADAWSTEAAHAATAIRTIAAFTLTNRSP